MKIKIVVVATLLLLSAIGTGSAMNRLRPNSDKTREAINTLPVQLRSAVDQLAVSGYRTRASSDKGRTDVEQVDEWIDKDGDINRSYADIHYRFRVSDKPALKNSDKEKKSLPDGMVLEYSQAAKQMTGDGFVSSIRGSAFSDNYMFLYRVVEKSSENPTTSKVYEIEEIKLEYLHTVDTRQPYPPY